MLSERRARVKAPQLAAAVGTTAGFVAQVMTPLVRAGWVVSDPGPAGGYRLAVAPGDISVLAVIEAVEGPTDAGRCVLADRPCTEHGACALHVPWMRARTRLLDELAATSVADGAMAGAAISGAAMQGHAAGAEPTGGRMGAGR